MLGRLLTRRILSATLVILAVLTAALAAMQVVRLGPLFLGPWVRPSDLGCIVALVPIVTLGLPASMAMAIAVVASNLSRSGERPALASAGVRPARVVAAPLACALACCAVTAFLSLVASPWAFGLLEESLGSLAVRAAFSSLPEGRFFDLPSGGVLYAGRKSPGDGRRIEDVVVSLAPEGASPVTISARRAVIEHEGSGACRMTFEQAVMSAADGVQAQAEVMTMPLDLGAVIASRRDELPAILSRPTSGMDPRGPFLERFHLNRRLAVPLASLFLVLVAASLLLPATLRRHWIAPAILAGAILSYHAISRAAEEMVVSGAIPPEPGAWIPAAALATACAISLAWIRPGAG